MDLHDSVRYGLIDFVDAHHSRARRCTMVHLDDMMTCDEDMMRTNDDPHKSMDILKSVSVACYR